MTDFLERTLDAVSVVTGWPRPRARCIADQHRDTADTGPGVDTPSADVAGARLLRPVPWVALADHHGWDPWAFDPRRSQQMVSQDLCQLCGSPRGNTVYALATDAQLRAGLTASVEHLGGALCSLRCARLTAAVCPHYRRHWPIHIYQVSKTPRIGITDPNHPTDDSYDLHAISPIAVMGMDRQPSPHQRSIPNNPPVRHLHQLTR